MYQIFVEVEGNKVFTGLKVNTEAEASSICETYNKKYNALHTYEKSKMAA